MKVSCCSSWAPIALSLALVVSFPAVCQVGFDEYELNFQEVKGLYGRSLGKIRNITQDPYGYMWFSGEEEKCIYRYDGRNVTVFRKDNFDPNTMGGVDVNVVYADVSGIIWVGFAGSGLDKFNPASKIFTHYRHDEANKRSLASDNVQAILNDSQGRIWVGTDRGLDRFDAATGEFTHYQNDPNDIHSLSNDFVINIYEDRQGFIWVATAGYPWIVPDPEQGGLNRLDANGTFTQFKHDPNDEHSLISNKVLAIYEDSRGTFWIGTNGNGLHTLDRKTGRFERHLYDPDQPQKLSRPPLKPDPFCKAFDLITFITEDHAGAIWIGSMCSGLIRYDPVNGATTWYEESNGYPHSTSWNGFVSRDGALWIATQESDLYRVNPIRKVFKTKKLDSPITRFLENEDGTLWAASESGLLRLDNDGTILEKFPIRQSNGNMLEVVDIHRNIDHVLLLGTNDGVIVFDIRTEEYKPLDLGFDGGRTIKILQDQSHPDWKWITTMEGGLIKYNSSRGVIKRYTHNKNSPATIASDHIIQLVDDANYLWIGTRYGVSRLNKRTDSLTNYLNLKCTFLFIDSRNTLWAGSENGLFRYNASANQFMLTEYHSVIATDRTYGIIEDNQLNLWITTPSSIVRIDSSREVVSQFGTQNRIKQGSILPAAIYKTAKGSILVGNQIGYYIVDPAEFNDAEKSPAVIFTEFLIHVSDRSINLKNILETPVNEVAPVNLSHDQNTFSIGLMLPDYRDPEGNHFQARLLRHDDSWRDLASANSSNYFAVPPGNYIYQVRGYTTSGSVIEKSISIVITPPWWNTWWAYSTYALIFILLLVGGRRMIVRQELLKTKLKIEHLNFEKAKEVDRVKTSFFTNISHEFRTPLTLIKGPVQELLEKYSNDPRTKDKLKLIQRNSDLLLKLINQLLDLARVEAGRLMLEKSEGDVYTFIRAIANSFESFALQKGISLSVEVPVVSKVIAYDKDKVETIIVNLINNAIKFTPSGGSVHLRARVDEFELRLSVRDTGIGISKNDHAKIFERFKQVSEAHKEVGTGIGLSLVRELVMFMGGTIDVISEQGEGSEFTLSIPVKAAIENSPEMTELTWEAVTSVDPTAQSLLTDTDKSGDNQNGHQTDHGRPQILVVEDNMDVRKFIIDCLGPEFTYIEAQNGIAGLEKAQVEIPDLIVSDVMMPEMDGMQMTQKIKADIRTSHIPLIMLTARSTEDSKLQGLNTGADDYLVKPFNKAELLFKVRNSIYKQQKLRERVRAELMSSSPRIEVVSQDERFLKNVKDKILERMNDEQLSVESLGEDIGLSRSQLLRKVTALTGMSVNELIRKLRLHRAAQLIAQEWGPVSQVAYEVGFSNLSYFSKMFKEEFGVSPSEYKEKAASS